jgi:metal-dependent hydrolase (beta-lactamase superfamily II)
VLDLGVGTTWTGHCTGETAFAVLRESMGARVAEFRTGTRLEF